MVETQIVVTPLESADPTFESGSIHSAVAQMTNPTTAPFSYTAELYLGAGKVVTTGVISFTLAAGASVNVNFPLAMPVAQGVYEVYLDVWVGSDLLAHFRGTVDVTVETSPAINVGPITWV